MRRSQAKSATKERLLQAAEAVFVDSDFRASTAVIARKIGVSHGTIFFHFKNRDELVLSVVRRLVLRLAQPLSVAYKSTPSLEEFLRIHFDTIRSNWALFKSLFSGFSDFSDETKQEVICLLSVINYYLVEAFNRWTDHGLVRTMLWQGSLIYLSFLGDYMFDKKKISEEFVQTLISSLTGSLMQTPESRGKKKGPREGKLCISCGMFLGSAGDFALVDKNKDYCRYCADDKGKLRSFDEVIDIMTVFLQETQGLNKDAAHHAAFAILSKNPAWREYVKKYS